jgi:hypothetical protein
MNYELKFFLHPSKRIGKGTLSFVRYSFIYHQAFKKQKVLTVLTVLTDSGVKFLRKTDLTDFV